MGVIEQVIQTASAGERIGLAVRDVAGGGKLAISLSGHYILEMPYSNEILIDGCWRGLEVPGLVEEAADSLFLRYKVQ